MMFRATTALLAAAAIASPALAQHYISPVNQTTSTFAASASVNVAFNASLIGYYLNQPPAPNALLTRTIQGTSGGTTAAPTNQTISPVRGSVVSSGSGNTKPSGTFVIKFSSTTNRVDLYRLDANLIGASAPPSLPINITITNLPGFRSRDPNYTYPTIPNFLIPSLTVPLGGGTLDALSVRSTAAAFATATPSTGGSYTFSLSLPADANLTFTLPTGVTLLTIPATLAVTGTVTPGNDTLASSLNFSLAINNPVPPTPADPPPTPQLVELPPPPLSTGPNANVLFTAFITGGTTSLTGPAALPGSGPRSNRADLAAFGGEFGADGELSIEDFITFLAGFTDNDPIADLTGPGGPPVEPDGDFSIEDFITFLAEFTEGS